MREEYKIYLTVFAQQAARPTSVEATASCIARNTIQNQAAAALAVLDAKMLEQGKWERVRSYYEFQAVLEAMLAQMPVAPSSAS